MFFWFLYLLYIALVSADLLLDDFPSNNQTNKNLQNWDSRSKGLGRPDSLHITKSSESIYYMSRLGTDVLLFDSTPFQSIAISFSSNSSYAYNATYQPFRVSVFYIKESKRISTHLKPDIKKPLLNTRLEYNLNTIPSECRSSLFLLRIKTFNPSHTIRLYTIIFTSIPRLKSISSDIDENCPICFKPVDKPFKAFECMHTVFHQSCLSTAREARWTAYHLKLNCPLCRAKELPEFSPIYTLLSAKESNALSPEDRQMATATMQRIEETRIQVEQDVADRLALHLITISQDIDSGRYTLAADIITLIYNILPTLNFKKVVLKLIHLEPNTQYLIHLAISTASLRYFGNELSWFIKYSIPCDYSLIEFYRIYLRAGKFVLADVFVTSHSLTQAPIDVIAMLSSAIAYQSYLPHVIKILSMVELPRDVDALYLQLYEGGLMKRWLIVRELMDVMFRKYGYQFCFATAFQKYLRKYERKMPGFMHLYLEEQCGT